MESDFPLFSNFKSKFNPAGFSGCYIEDRGMNIINFIVPIATELTLEQAENLQKEYINKLELALGSDYAINFSIDGFVISFVNRFQPQKKIIKIVFDYDSGKYSMNLYIVADR